MVKLVNRLLIVLLVMRTMARGELEGGGGGGGGLFWALVNL